MARQFIIIIKFLSLLTLFYQSPPPQDEGEGSEEVLSSVVPPLVDFLSREISESDRFDEGDQETVCSCLFRYV